MARTVRVDKIQVDIEVNGNKVKNEYKSLRKEASILANKIQEMEIGTKEWIEANKKLNEINARMREARQIARGIGQEQSLLTRITSRFGDVAKKVFSPLGALMAGMSLGHFVNELFLSAVELETFQKKSKTVFGEALVDVERFAAKNATAMGLTRNEYIATATQAGDLLIPMGFQREEAAKLSNDLVGLSGALAEWNNVQGGAKATSEILTKALLGEREQLKSLGISIQEADVKTRLAAKGQDELKGSALQQAKALATLELIYEKSSDAQEAYSNNAGSLARQMSTLRATFQDVWQSLAQRLIPAFGKALGFLGDLIGTNQSYSDVLEEERIEMNLLVGQILRTNEGTDAHKKLIDELNARYPEFLKNLDQSKITNAAIAKQLKEVNEEMVNQIVLQQKQEEIQSTLQKAGETRSAQIKNEKVIGESLLKITEKYNLEVDNTRPLLEQTQKAISELDKLSYLNFSNLFDRKGYNEARNNLERLVQSATGLERQNNIYLEQLNSLQEEKNELVTRFGLQVQEEEETKETNTKTSDNEVISAADRKRREKSREKAIKKEFKAESDAQIAIKRLRLEVQEDGISKEIALVELHAEEKKAKLIGTEAQIREQSLLIEQQKQRDIQRLQTNYTQTQIDELRKNSLEKVKALEEGAEAIEAVSEKAATEIRQIEVDLQEEISIIQAQTISEAKKANLIQKATDTAEAKKIAAQKIALEKKLQEDINTIIVRGQSEQIEVAKSIASVRREIATSVDQVTEDKLTQELVAIEVDRQNKLAEIDVKTSNTRAVEEQIKSINQEATQKRLILISQESETANALVEIERLKQERIKAIQESDINQVEKDSQIQIINTLAIEEQLAVISVATETASKRTQVETDLANDLIRIKRESVTLQATIEKQTQEASLTESERLFQQRITQLEAYIQKKAISATQEAIQAGLRGEELAVVEVTLRKKLLQIQLEFLQQKKALEESFGLSSIKTSQEIADLQRQIQTGIGEDNNQIQNTIKSLLDLGFTIEQIAAKTGLSVEEINAALGAIQAGEQIDKIVNLSQTASQALNQLLTIQSNNIKKSLDEQLSLTQTQKNAEIKAAGDNSKKKEAIEKKYAKIEENIRTESARREQQIALKRAFIDLSLGILKAIASAPFPKNLPAIAQAGILGGIQVATIASNGFFDGGLTGKAPNGIKADASGHKPVGVVHEGEWVANADMVQDPLIGPIIHRLEQIRTKRFSHGVGTASMAGLPAALPGFAIGGFADYSGNTPSPQVIDLVQQPPNSAKTDALLEKLIVAVTQVQLHIGEYEADKIRDLQENLTKRRSSQRLS